MKPLSSSRDWIFGKAKLIPTWAWITFTLLVILLITGGLAVCNWDWLQSAGSDIEESNSTTFRNVGLLIGAILAGILAIWRSSVAEGQAKATHHQAAVAQAQANTAQESLRHDRYQRGAEMLGSELLPVRLAGISALKRLAAYYPEEYHIQVMELFCGFARNPTGKQESPDGQPVDLEKLRSDLSRYREDVEAVVKAIGQRGKEGRKLEADAGFTVDLHGADLTHVTLKEADLTGANLTRAKLPMVYAGHVDLSGASLIAADLSGMSGHHLELSGADLARADLTSMEAPFTTFCNATLYGAELCGANLRGSNFRGATFGRNNLTTVRLEESDFSGALLPGDVAIAQFQLDSITWDPGNPPVLVTGAIDVTTDKPLILRE